jgi:hypothetical protein
VALPFCGGIAPAHAELDAGDYAVGATTTSEERARLLEARRTKCHTLEQVVAARHTPIGWWFTVARMRWWNGAAMTGEEAALR